MPGDHNVLNWPFCPSPWRAIWHETDEIATPAAFKGVSAALPVYEVDGVTTLLTTWPPPDRNYSRT
jgi:hypothetical protein